MLLLTVTSVTAGLAMAQAPDSFTFQGFLKDDDGNPVDTVVTMESKLYDGTTLLHEQTHADVDVVNGVFNLTITDTDTVAFVGGFNIGIKVGADPEMLPRTPILMAPYAQSLIGFRVYPAEHDVPGAGPNIVGGHNNNFFSRGVGGASVLGGGTNLQPNAVNASYGTVAGGVDNKVDADYGSILGGHHNRASNTNSSVTGGESNEASGSYSFVGGGANNTASGLRSTVPGGKGNRAYGTNSFAAGEVAAAKHNGAFVWQDASAGATDTLASTVANQFTVRAAGGVRLFTAGAPDLTTGAFLAAGATGWAAISSKSAKEDFVEVNPKEYLDRVAGLDIQEWRYKAEGSNITHVGPFAEEFFAAFGHGPNNMSITTTDADGVALVAIQGLYELVQEQAATIAELKERLARLE